MPHQVTSGAQGAAHNPAPHTLPSTPPAVALTDLVGPLAGVQGGGRVQRRQAPLKGGAAVGGRRLERRRLGLAAHAHLWVAGRRPGVRCGGGSACQNRRSPQRPEQGVPPAWGGTTAPTAPARCTPCHLCAHLVARLHQPPHVHRQPLHWDGGRQEAVVRVGVQPQHARRRLGVLAEEAAAQGVQRGEGREQRTTLVGLQSWQCAAGSSALLPRILDAPVSLRQPCSNRHCPPLLHLAARPPPTGTCSRPPPPAAPRDLRGAEQRPAPPGVCTWGGRRRHRPRQGPCRCCWPPAAQGRPGWAHCRPAWPARAPCGAGRAARAAPPRPRRRARALTTWPPAAATAEVAVRRAAQRLPRLSRWGPPVWRAAAAWLEAAPPPARRRRAQTYPFVLAPWRQRTR